MRNSIFEPSTLSIKIPKYQHEIIGKTLIHIDPENDFCIPYNLLKEKVIKDYIGIGEVGNDIKQGINLLRFKDEMIFSKLTGIRELIESGIQGVVITEHSKIFKERNFPTENYLQQIFELTSPGGIILAPNLTEQYGKILESLGYKKEKDIVFRKN